MQDMRYKTPDLIYEIHDSGLVIFKSYKSIEQNA